MPKIGQKQWLIDGSIADRGDHFASLQVLLCTWGDCKKNTYPISRTEASIEVQLCLQNVTDSIDLLIIRFRRWLAFSCPSHSCMAVGLDSIRVSCGVRSESLS